MSEAVIGRSKRVALLAGLLAVAVAIAACACKQGNKAPAGPQDSDDAAATSGDTAACDAVRPAVEALYQKELVDPASDAAKQEVARQAVEDNTDMVMNDCRTAPGRFAPCLKAAVSVQQMERDCVIPLDDAGRVEGKEFGGR